MPWPGDIESVTIIWMDDRKETYNCNTVEVGDGELRLSSVYKSSMVTQVRDERSFPLANIRVHTVNRVS
jgi:hypothetical protein